ncbi:hypothetical protein ACFH04_22450 [Streptomyces noboritoensis]|uniref:Uncharacterized protein n=1 Tax=Streptomyces noboritoensis TaxID=67337 RepID=A0ABV6TMR8_9ACTN
MGPIERPRRVVQPPATAPVQPLQQTGTARSGHQPWQPAPQQERTAQRRGATAPPLRHALYGNRSADLREALSRLDAQVDEAARRQLADWIREEYEVQHTAIPVGFVTKCYLGAPFVDHILDLAGAIVEHYAPGTPMPEPFGAGRMLARSGSYVCVEVYGDGLVLPVLPDGSVVQP